MIIIIYLLMFAAVYYYWRRDTAAAATEQRTAAADVGQTMASADVEQTLVAASMDQMFVTNRTDSRHVPPPPSADLTLYNDSSWTQEIRCPFCAEIILAAAKKCKHCGEWLEAPPIRPHAARLVADGTPGIPHDQVRNPMQNSPPLIFEGTNRILRLYDDRVEISHLQTGTLDRLGAFLDSGDRVVPYRQIQSVQLIQPNRSKAGMLFGALQALDGDVLSAGVTMAGTAGILQIGLAGVPAPVPNAANLFAVQSRDPYAVVFDDKSTAAFVEAARLIRERIAR